MKNEYLQTGLIKAAPTDADDAATWRFRFAMAFVFAVGGWMTVIALVALWPR